MWDDGARLRTPGYGFTLVELLIAVVLFMGIAFMLYSFIRGGVTMWRTGERRQDLYERAQTALDRMASDLWCTFRPQVFEEARPVAMFLADRPGQASREPRQGDPERDPVAVLGSRLRFVRTLRGEFQNPVTRFGGLVPGATEHFQFELSDVEVEEAAPHAYKAPGGLAEVLYQVVVLPGQDEAEGAGTLLRGWRTPVGGEGSYFDDAVVENPELWTRVLRPVVAGVLYLGLEFWDQSSETWEAGRADADAVQVWDSTRGLLRGFKYYKKGSEASDIDDLYPQRVRITLIVSRPGDPSMSAHLRGGAGKYEKQLRLDRPGGLAAYEEGVVLVGGQELMRITRTGATRAKVIQRGAYGTTPRDHGDRAPVVWGETFTRVVNVPSYRENWNR